MTNIAFPEFSGKRCLMMPFIQGVPESVPQEYRTGYEKILYETYIEKGARGFLTIDESKVLKSRPHRGARAQYGRALHTEAGKLPDALYAWGGGTWGGRANVLLDRDVKVLLANSMDDTCAIWPTNHENTSLDGDIGYCASDYPYSDAVMMKAGEVHQIGILTPHESLPVDNNCNRQFIRIIGSGVYGRESYFTRNPLITGELD